MIETSCCSQSGVQTAVAPAAGAATLTREEACSRPLLRRVAAMLDLDTAACEAAPCLPRGWHFVLMGADTPRRALRSDGFPGLGVSMPDLPGLPRLMLGGRQVRFLGDIPVGATLQRHSGLRNVVHKANAAGPMAVVTLDHALHLPDQEEPVLQETQTYLMLPARRADEALGAPAVAPVPVPLPAAAHCKTLVPDETLLFQYSALGFNSHRIHLDRDHARQVEGFPDLVVNGGLVTLLLTEFLRIDLGLAPAAIRVRHLAPLYCHRALTLTAEPVDQRWQLNAFDDRQQLAVSMEVDVL